MKLLLSSETSIRDVNVEFSKNFPFLKLEFYSWPHKKGQSSQQEYKLPNSYRLGSISGLFKPRMLEIKPDETVASLEQRFQNEFGLPVQIFRKTGDQWIETTQTDHLTLEKQNNIGAAASKPARINIYTLFL